MRQGDISEGLVQRRGCHASLEGIEYVVPPLYRRVLTITRSVIKELLLALPALIKRQRRGRETVMSEYDRGGWKAVAEARRWETSRDLDEYLNPPSDRRRQSVIKDKLVWINEHFYYEFRNRCLKEILSNYTEHASELVELGCGTGYNILSLARTGYWRKIYGYDISETGITTARTVAGRFGLRNCNFNLLDLTNIDYETSRLLRGKTVFTYYCMEQLKHQTGKVIQGLLSAGVRRVVHIEPATEMLRLASCRDWITRLYIFRNDYQDNLLKTLHAFESHHRLKILDSYRLFYAPTIRHDPMLVCWEPVEQNQN
jgi:SAM-dependent methyltransferase